MRVFTAAIVCAAALYLLDAYFFDGKYFVALSQVVARAVRGQ